MKPHDITSLRTKSALDISEDALAEISVEATKLISEYFATIRERPIKSPNYGGKTAELIDVELPAEGKSLEQIINDCRTVFDLSRHNGHPRFFGYVASPSTPIGAYADLLASALNANITAWRSGPAGVEVERLVVRWLGKLIGYDEDAKGLLTSGGSMANMIAMLIACRSRAGKETSISGLWNSGTPMTIYASPEVHMSIAKAADILGIGRAQVRMADCVEGSQKIDVESLRKLIDSDLKEGFRPFCIVASAGTVNTGVVDPLDEVADVAAEFDLWFHVDGAYGAPGRLDPRKRDLFAGLERADSVSLDPHKWLYVPVDVGCLLFRDEDVAKSAFSTEDADYIKVHGHVDSEAFAFWDYGVELSRRFRALKVWLTLQYYGTQRISQSISEDIALAEYMGQLVAAADDLELMTGVELSICCFRYVPAEFVARLKTASYDERSVIEKELDKLNEQVMGLIQNGGRAYLSNATVNGSFALRACVTNFRTTKADIEETLSLVREMGQKALVTSSLIEAK